MKVRFVWLRREIDETKSYKCPKKVEDKLAWLKSARDVFPGIPLTVAPSKWFITNFSATALRVVFVLDNGEDTNNKLHDYCHVIINRKASSLG